ncbi:MAG: corrinoid protein [Coriobacteriales bacterium]|jgi:methanogenic corrinoid protein MtbC1
MAILDDVKQAVEKGDFNNIADLTNKAIEEGNDPQAILDAEIAAMDYVGEQFSAGKLFVPEMLLAAHTMTQSTEILKPLMAGDAGASLGKAIIGTVKGDMHDIGKNLVRMMVEGKGIEVIDLGVDVPPEKFVETVKANPDCHLVLCSSLLTTTRDAIGDTIEALKEAGLRDQVKVMVGGAPVNQEFCDRVGGDAYTKDAGEAASVAAKLLSQAA